MYMNVCICIKIYIHVYMYAQCASCISEIFTFSSVSLSLYDLKCTGSAGRRIHRRPRILSQFD